MSRVISRTISKPAPAQSGTLIAQWILPLAILTAVFMAAIAFVGPSGDFPLNDDWSFAATTRRLVSTGNWSPTGWASMPLITNSLWAAPVCWLTSCSFEDLRITTLVATELLVIATFVLVKLQTKGWVQAFAAAFLMCFNPIAFALSFTFMTDILFAALVTLSALCFIVAIERDSMRLVVFGTALAIAGTLSRQLGLCVPLAFAAVQVARPDRSLRRVGIALVPIALCAGSLIAFNFWMKQTGRTPADYDIQSNLLLSSLRSPRELLIIAKSNVVTVFLYLGLFSLPMLLLTAGPAVEAEGTWLKRLPRIIAAIATILAVVAMIGGHRMMPFGKNYLNTGGVGLPTLYGQFKTVNQLPQLPELWWIFVTLVSLAGVFVGVDRIARFYINTIDRRWRKQDDLSWLGPTFALVAIVVYFTPLMPISIFDRYIIIVLPLLLYFFSRTAAPRRVAWSRVSVATAVGGIMAIFAVLAVHDNLVWNRLRWAIIAQVENSHIANASNLDGGFEYNGMRGYDPHYIKAPEKSPWWVIKDDYMITFNLVDGFEVVQKYPYRTILPPFDRSLYLLHKLGNSGAINGTSASQSLK